MNSQLLIEVSLIGSAFLIFGIGWLLSRNSGPDAGNKLERILTGLIGSFLLMAGTVKFFAPFADMFAAQVALSGLPFPTLSKWAGQMGEILAGALFLLVLFTQSHLGKAMTDRLFFSATGLTGIIMVVAIFVHMQPNVPAAVLPLQSKPPVLALVVMALVGINAWQRITGNTERRNGASLTE